jgi:hypothetical protein
MLNDRAVWAGWVINMSLVTYTDMSQILPPLLLFASPLLRLDRRQQQVASTYARSKRYKFSPQEGR